MKRSKLLPASVAIEAFLILLLFVAFFMLFRVEIPVTMDSKATYQPPTPASGHESPVITDQCQVKTITLYEYLLDRFKKRKFVR